MKIQWPTAVVASVFIVAMVVFGVLVPDQAPAVLVAIGSAGTVAGALMEKALRSRGAK
jgi:hypothetical protein